MSGVARLQQQHAAEQEQQQEVLDIQTEFNEFFMRFLVDNNLPLHLVENETTKAFFNKFIPHLKLPSRYELSGSLLIALYITVMMDVKQRVAEAPFVALTMDGWAKSLGAAHLLGVCAVLAGRVSVFLDVINTAGHSATSELMLIEMLGVIEKHDLAGKVCAVVTDTPTHDTVTSNQLRAAEDLATRLASADGRGSDSAVDQGPATQVYRVLPHSYRVLRPSSTGFCRTPTGSCDPRLQGSAARLQGPATHVYRVLPHADRVLRRLFTGFCRTPTGSCDPRLQGSAARLQGPATFVYRVLPHAYRVLRRLFAGFCRTPTGSCVVCLQGFAARLQGPTTFVYRVLPHAYRVLRRLATGFCRTPTGSCDAILQGSAARLLGSAPHVCRVLPHAYRVLRHTVQDCFTNIHSREQIRLQLARLSPSHSRQQELEQQLGQEQSAMGSMHQGYGDQHWYMFDATKIFTVFVTSFEHGEGYGRMFFVPAHSLSRS
ncbi:hypothetical protein V8C86DRAFT_3023063 [Haematococcus lacustris]